MERKQFTFYRSYYEAISCLPKEEQCAVILAVAAYALDETEPTLEGTAKAIFSLIRPTLDSEIRESREGRTSAEYVTWRKRVFERDNYTCQNCGIRGAKLNAHHIKPYAYFHDLRYDLGNGISLCVECHKQIHKRGR